jgi:hypothetical protein
MSTSLSSSALSHGNEIAVARLPTRPTDLPPLYRADVRSGIWLPLRQAWRGELTETNFRPGWFRLAWCQEALVVDSVFVSPRAHNAARGLNERTWELGEVTETFIEPQGALHYLEVHVTPENQRLQLRFPHGAIEQLRAGTVALDTYLITDSAWARSSAWIRGDHWAARLILPASCLGPGFLAEGQSFRGNFCRYDCADAGEPILSATAPLTEPSYHRRQEWQTFRLSAQEAVCERT